MKIYFAPMEGVTDAVFRKVHHEMFPGIDKYFLPFISPTERLTFTARELAAISPEENRGIRAVPQLLTKNAGHFVRMTRRLADIGYTEVNLNLGCPSGTVTAKGKGSGMLRDLEELKAFLDGVFSQSALPVSVKTRIGYQSLSEWPAIASLLSEYPIYELIVHPRTRGEFYKGTAHTELCGRVCDLQDIPFVYNGDLFTAEDCRNLLVRYPKCAALMLGRGLVCNPMLAREFGAGEKLTREILRNFHDKLLETYIRRWPPNAVVGHMHEIMSYMSCCFENPHKARKAIRKSTTISAYADAAARLFEEYPLSDCPSFMQE